MKALVTMKGQVTIPKELREKFGIERGSQVDFVAGTDGIRLRKVIDRTKRLAVLGCLKKELAGRSVDELLDDLRGPVELPPARRKEKTGMSAVAVDTSVLLAIFKGEAQGEAGWSACNQRRKRPCCSSRPWSWQRSGLSFHPMIRAARPCAVST